MKRIRLIKLWQKVLFFILGMLGFSYCSPKITLNNQNNINDLNNQNNNNLNNEEPIDYALTLYGCPSSLFVVKGTVLNHNNEKIENAKVIVKRKHVNDYNVIDTIYTDKQGNFEFSSDERVWVMTLRLVFYEQDEAKDSTIVRLSSDADVYPIVNIKLKE